MATMHDSVIDKLNQIESFDPECTFTEEHFDGGYFENLLIGLSVVRVDYMEEGVEHAVLTLSNGYKLHIRANEGCGGCQNGWSTLPNLRILENTDNCITDVKLEYLDDDEKFKIFVFYHDKRFDTVIEGGDDGYGNGYYGGGFTLSVEKGIKSVGIDMSSKTIKRLDSLPKYRSDLMYGEFITGVDFPRILQGLCIISVIRGARDNKFTLVLTGGYKLHIWLNDAEDLYSRISSSNIPNLFPLINPNGVITDISAEYYIDRNTSRELFRVTAIYSDHTVRHTSGKGCDEVVDGCGGFFVVIEQPKDME